MAGAVAGAVCTTGERITEVAAALKEVVIGFAEAARLGLIDPVFPAGAWTLIRVWYWNLREPSAPMQPLPG